MGMVKVQFRRSGFRCLGPRNDVDVIAMATYEVDASQVFRFGREGRDWRFVLPGEEEFTPEGVLKALELEGEDVAESLELSKQSDFMLEEWLTNLAKPDQPVEVETDDDGNPIETDDGSGSGDDTGDQDGDADNPDGEGDSPETETKDEDGPVMTSDQLSSDDPGDDVIPETETEPTPDANPKGKGKGKGKGKSRKG